MKTIQYTKYLYGYLIEITLDNIQIEWIKPEEALYNIDWSSSIPDNIRELIIRGLEEDDTGGSFNHKDTKDDIDFDYYQMEVSFSGSWRILKLDFSLMTNIALWNYNHYQDEMLSKEVFIKYYGEYYGSHFYEKWEYAYERNIIKMFSYFRGEPDNGQKFCNMLIEQVQKYLNRTKPNIKQNNNVNVISSILPSLYLACNSLIVCRAAIISLCVDVLFLKDEGLVCNT